MHTAPLKDSKVGSNAILDGSRFHCTIARSRTSTYYSLLLCRFVFRPKDGSFGMLNIRWQTYGYYSMNYFVVLTGMAGQGFFLVFSAAEIRPLSQWDLGDFFPNLKKKIPNLKKRKRKCYSVILFSLSLHTHKLHGDSLLLLHLIFLQFNGNSMCNS